MTQIILTPPQVRQRVRAQHREIREMMDSVEAMVGMVSEDPKQGARIRYAMAVLTEILELHMAFEERHLFPALHAAARFGPQGVAGLQREHERQRHELAQLSQLFVEGDTPSLAWKVRAFSRWLRDDMAHEEREALRPGLLGTDVAAAACPA